MWFVVQIALPFTAPLQTCDLRDLFGSKHTNDQPDNSATPLPSDSESAIDAFLSPIESSALLVSTGIAAVPFVALYAPLMGSFDLSLAPQFQQAVLRV
jgi:hypothetical protein